MTRKQEYKQLEEKLLTPDQLRKLKAFDEQVRHSNKRHNELVTCESDLDEDELDEYNNYKE